MLDNLKGGKSDRYGRSYGLFVRVRGRVINLEDEHFGLPTQNHAAWSRFYLEVNVDGLSEFLQSSREGVREAKPVRDLREYSLAKFLRRWRRAYERYLEEAVDGRSKYINFFPMDRRR